LSFPVQGAGGAAPRGSVFSMRRSGTSHITATSTYTAQAIAGLRNAIGSAIAYSTTEIFPLKSRPSAVAMTESLPCSAISDRARMK